jgi:hypothetical protein
VQDFAGESSDISKSVRCALDSQLKIVELSPLTELIDAYKNRNHGNPSADEQRAHIKKMVEVNMPDSVEVALPSDYTESLVGGSPNQSQPVLAAE